MRTLLRILANATVLFVTVSGTASGQVLNTVSIPSNSCCSVDVNSSTDRIFVSGGASFGQIITMLDGNTGAILHTLGTGSGARVNPVTNKVYAGAVFSPSQGFLVYDGSTGNLLKTITAFDCPIAAAVDVSSNRIWGSAQCGGGNDAIFLVDGGTDTLLSPPGRIGSGGVMGNIVINQVTHLAYVYPSAVSKRVDPVSFAVSVNPFSGVVIAADPVQNRLYAWNQSAGQIQVIDGNTQAILTTFAGAGFGTVNAVQERAYIADQSSHSILVIDAVSEKLLGSIAIPGTAGFGEIAVNSTSGLLYLPTVDSSGASLLIVKDNVTPTQNLQLTVNLAGSGSGTVTSNPTGITCTTPANQCSASFATGATVTLTAAPATGSNFVAWLGCDSVAGAICTVKMSSARAVTVTFTNSVPLTVTRNGNGAGSVTSTPAGINCSPSTNQCLATFPPGTQVSLIAAAAAGSVFGGWSGCDQVAGLNCAVLLSGAPRSVTATFVKLVSLTVASNGTGTGTVTSNPTGINCGPAANQCTAVFPSGSQAKLTAIPSPGSNFGGWSGCDNVTGTVCTVIFGSAARTATVTFVKGRAVFGVISVIRVGTGTGTITSNPPGLFCAPASGNPCTGTFTTGTQVTLTATPTIFSDFGGWSGCGKVSGLSCTVTLTSSRMLSVAFNGGTPVSRNLQVSVIGPGSGLVTSNPGGISCPFTCFATFEPIQQTIVLAAFPDAGSSFGSWSGCDQVSGITCVVLLSNVTRLVTAKFTKLPASVQLQVIHSGTGTGTISSSPPGLFCAPTSGNPCSGTFPGGTQVTLTAIPTIFSDFGGWFGCNKVSGLNCTVDLRTSQTVFVTFNGGTPVSRNLQVSVFGPGSGQVISNPGGISCPFTCFATFEPIQQTIVLTALPTGRSRFTGWNGCDSVAGTNCVVLLSNFTRMVTARFN